MPTLTYPDLGPDADQLVGQLLGCDDTGWPYRVESVDTVYDVNRAKDVTLVDVEPWPLPAPGDTAAAQALASARRQLVVGPPAEIPGRPR